MSNCRSYTKLPAQRMPDYATGPFLTCAIGILLCLLTFVAKAQNNPVNTQNNPAKARNNPVNALNNNIISGKMSTTTDSVQKDTSGNIMDLARVRYLGPINKQIRFLALAAEALGQDSIPGLDQAPLLSADLVRGISPGLIERNLYLQFPLTNSADSSVRVYFFPGLYIAKMEL